LAEEGEHVNGRSKNVAWAVGRATLRAIRFSLYIVLLVLGRVLVPVAGLLTVGGLILFFFCLLFLRDETRLLVLGVCLAAGGVVLQVSYDAALRLVAPDSVVIVSEL
jgi:hypothetical protein